MAPSSCTQETSGYGRLNLPKLRRTLALTAFLAVTVFGSVFSSAEPWSLWRSYSASFMSAEGRIVDPQGGDRTTSEGQSYALFFALVANDRTSFDRLLNWTRNNLAAGDLATHLPAWCWGKAPDGQWKVLDTNSAADSDLWISYSLLEAGRLWNEPRYSALGKSMAANIAGQEIASLPGLGPVLLPGPTGFHPDANTWVLNPSYMPLSLLQKLAHLDPNGPWAGVARTLPHFFEHSAAHGFAMDWVSYNPQRGFSPAPAPGRNAALGSYDAIRVYLWAGMSDPLTPGAKSILASTPGMASYLGSHQTPPEQVSGEGVVISTNSPVGFSAAVIPYLDALGKTELRERQQARLEAGRNPTTGLYGRPPAYYDQNLVMFAKGWEERRFRFDRDGELKVTWKKT
jgi:endo-1,4-beta-D-glucanase Y